MAGTVINNGNAPIRCEDIRVRMRFLDPLSRLTDCSAPPAALSFSLPCLYTILRKQLRALCARNLTAVVSLLSMQHLHAGRLPVQLHPAPDTEDGLWHLQQAYWT